MGDRLALVTGACGEMGSAVVPALRARGFDVVALDLVAPPPPLASLCVETVATSVLDAPALEALVERHRPTHVFHLAAVLSRKAEEDPDRAHRVNVEGTYGILRLCEQAARQLRRDVRVLFPSSIAVYGLRDIEAKRAAGAVHEDEHVEPLGMYGCTKLYGEALGTYLTHRNRRDREPGVDFRAIRFPGLISADTLPTGGTTDYASEMIHAAARGAAFSCFVEPHTRLPFMTMPDAVGALLQLSNAGAEALSRRVYNIVGFAPTAAELLSETRKHFPDARVTFEPVPERQAIVDSWPETVDDTPARSDWGLSPRHDLGSAVAEYLVPALRRRYAVPQVTGGSGTPAR